MCPFVDSADLDRLVEEKVRSMVRGNVARVEQAPRSLPLSKLAQDGAASGDAALWDGSTWAPGGVATQAELDAHVTDADGAHAATAISVTESGIIIPGAMSVQQAMRAIEFQAEQDRQRLGSHHHDERYGTVAGKAVRSTAQTMNNGGWTDISFSSAIFARRVTVAGGTQPLTCIEPGIYSVACMAILINAGGAGRTCRIVHKNIGGTILEYVALDSAPSEASYFARMGGSDIIEMAIGDFLQMQVIQGSGGPLDLVADASSHFATISMAKH